MRKAAVAAMVLVLPSGSAWTESTQADWDQHAQPIVDEFGTCARVEVDRSWDSDDQSYEVARDAIARCEDRLEPLNKILAAEPFSQPLAGINATISQIKTEARAVIIEDVENRRKGN